MPYGSDNSELSNRYQSGSSYQSSHNYQPPSVSGTYAQQQTQVMEDTMRTHYEVRMDDFICLTLLFQLAVSKDF